MSTMLDYRTIGISFKDVLALPPFSGLTQFDLLLPKYDSLTAPYLYLFGCDIDTYPLVQACLHRSLSGDVWLGYRYVYPERNDNAWLKSRGCSLDSRIYFQGDLELRSDMLKMSREGFGWPKYKAGLKDKYSKEDSQLWSESIETIKALQYAQACVRGPLHPDEDLLNVE